MPLVGSNLIRLLNAGESGNVAAYSALFAVDKKFDVIAVLKLVRVSCLLQRLLRIIVYAELNASNLSPLSPTSTKRVSQWFPFSCGTR